MNNEFLRRTDILLGEEKRKIIQEKKVLVAGLGGVGGHCAEALVRLGVKNIVLVDFDCFDLSNLNRQIFATVDVLGKKKVEVAKNRLLSINPQLNLVLVDEFLDEKNIKELLIKEKIDFLFDCIDALNSKIFLIKTAISLKIPLISAMGAGNCLDAQKIKIDKLKNSSVCPLARLLRQRLKKERFNLNFPVVFSTEERTNKPLNIDGKNINGTISYLPAIFGLFMVNYFVRSELGIIAGKKNNY